MKKWESEKHKSWIFQQKDSRSMLPRTARCWEERASGEHVVEWCSWLTMHGMDGSMEAELE